MPDTGPAPLNMRAPDTVNAAAGPAPGMNRVLQNSSLYLIGNIASRAVGFLAIPFYSRLLTPTQFGIIDLIELSTQTVAIAFGLQSIGQALTRLFHDQTTAEQERDVVSTGLIATALISGIIALLAIALAGPLSEAIFGSGEQTTLLRAAFAAMFFSNLVEVVLVYERIRERAKFYLAYSLITLVATLVLNILFIGVLGAGVWGFVLSKLITTISGTVFLLGRAIRDVGVRWRSRYIPEFVRFGSPLILSSISYLAIHSSDRFFLAAAVSFADIGRYGLAYRFAFLVSVLVGESFGKSWNVSLYRYVNRDGWRQQFARVAAYLLFVLCFVGLGLSVFGRELLRFMVLPSFYPPALLLPTLVFAYVIREFGDFFRNLLLIRKRSGAVGLIAFGGALLNAALNMTLIPSYGIDGAAAATLITWVVYLIVCWVVAGREHAIPVSATRSLALIAGTLIVFALADATRVSGYFAQVLLDGVWCAAWAVTAVALYFSAAERSEIQAGAASLISRVFIRARRRPQLPAAGGLLVLAHAYPPQAGVPAIRAHRFVRHLEQAGVPVTVVTASTPDAPLTMAAPSGAPSSGYVMPVPGPSQAGLLTPGPGLLLHLAMRLLLPARERLAWVSHARAAGSAILARGSGQIILSTCPPAAGHFAALLLKRRHGLPWIADFQAPMECARTVSRRGNLFQPLLERLVFENADAIIAGTAPMGDVWRRRYPAWADKISVVWTGTQDGRDAGHRNHPARPPDGRLVIMQPGPSGPVLPTANSSAARLAASLLRLDSSGLLPADRFLLRLIGPGNNRTAGVLPRLADTERLHVDGRPLTGPELQREMIEADFLLLPDPPGAAGDLALPAGIFDCIQGCRPMIAVTARGSATSTLLQRSGSRHLCIDPADPDHTTDAALAAFLGATHGPSHPDPSFLVAFDSRRQAGELLGIITRLAPTAIDRSARLRTVDRRAVARPVDPPRRPERAVLPLAAAPRVSIIMAVFNGSGLIRQSLDSIFAQTFTAFELIVVDDCSTDATTQILDEYDDPRLRVLHNRRNIGVVGSRNAGFAVARGEYIAILDHDDLSLPVRLARQVAFLDAHTDTVAVGTDGLIFQNNALRPFDHPRQTGAALVRWLLHVRNPLIFSSVMMRAAALRTLACFTDPDFECAEDFQLYHRLMSAGSIARVDERLTIYRLHLSNMTRMRQDFVISQTARVLRPAYDRLLGAQGDRIATLVARHVMAGRSAVDAAHLIELGTGLDALLRAFIAAHAPSPAEAAAMWAQTSRLWWQAVRAAVRAGRPRLLSCYGAVPALAQDTRPPLRDLTDALVRGCVLTVWRAAGVRRGLRERRRNSPSPRPSPVTVGGVDLLPGTIGDHRPPTLCVVLEVDPGDPADALDDVLDRHGIRPICLLKGDGPPLPWLRARIGAGTASAGLRLTLAGTAPDRWGALVADRVAAVRRDYGISPLFVRTDPGSFSQPLMDLLARHGFAVDLSIVAGRDLRATGGPDFRACHGLPYEVAGTGLICLPATRGSLGPLGRDGRPVDRVLRMPRARRLGLEPLLEGARLVRPVGPDPAARPADLIRLLDRLVRRGDRIFVLTCATPAASADGLRAVCDHFFDVIEGITGDPADLVPSRPRAVTAPVLELAGE